MRELPPILSVARFTGLQAGEYDVMSYSSSWTLRRDAALGITQANVDAMLESPVPAVRRLLGVADELGPTMGLDKRWAYNIIKALGNYGEIFERHLGSGSALKLARGANALYSDGGLMISMAVQ